MGKQEIPVRFADLRRLARSVPAYLAERAGETIVPTLRTELEEGLSLYGDDTVETITGFARTYHVEIVEFDFTGLISPEGTDLAAFLLFLLQFAYPLVGSLLKAVLSLLCWPIASHLAKRIWQQQLPRFWPPANEHSQPDALTIGDFVASAAVGRFVRREQVCFQLVRY